MKFDLLLEYNMRKIFFEKSYIKYSGKTSVPDSFLKN